MKTVSGLSSNNFITDLDIEVVQELPSVGEVLVLLSELQTYFFVYGDHSYTEVLTNTQRNEHRYSLVFVM